MSYFVYKQNPRQGTRAKAGFVGRSGDSGLGDRFRFHRLIERTIALATTIAVFDVDNDSYVTPTHLITSHQPRKSLPFNPPPTTTFLL